MTRRGRLALALGAVTYLAAWAFGSKALYPPAFGLVLAVAIAWAWMRTARRPVRLQWTSGKSVHSEGEDVEVSIEVALAGGMVPPGAVVVRQRISKLGERATRLARRGSGLRARYVLERLPRGRYVLEQATAVLEDPFGLERVEVELPSTAALLVYPRLTVLDRLFSDSGASLPDGRHLLLRRPSGFELHSVREYQQGESLRRVHWRSTAKRGRLMVKELEDAPRDEVAVLLDAQAEGAVGECFDVQVRAAGSILLAYATRGRRGLLVVNGAVTQTAAVTSVDTDWKHALELLAAAEPDGHRPVASLLANEAGSLVRALELTVVTSTLTPQLADRVVQHSMARRRVSIVYVDAASFAPSPRRRVEPSLRRLQGIGVPVAVVRRGDDLGAVLGGGVLTEAVRA